MDNNEKPPVFKTWSGWYWLVLGFLIAQVILFLLAHKAVCMNYLDWSVLVITIAFIVLYGTLKTPRRKKHRGLFEGR